MGMFGNVASVKGAVDSNYFSPGTYICRVEKVKGYKGRKGEGVAVEMTVVHVVTDDKTSGKRPHMVGEAVSRIFPNYGGTVDYFLPELKAFVACAFGCGMSDFDADAGTIEAVEIAKFFDEVVSTSQPLAGTVVEVFVKQNDYTNKSGEHKSRTDVKFKRRIPFAAILKNEVSLGGILTEQEKARFWKPGDIEALSAKEAAEAAEIARQQKSAA